MAFNPSESIDIKVLMNISDFAQTPTAGFWESRIKKNKEIIIIIKERERAGPIPSHQEVWAAVF